MKTLALRAMLGLAAAAGALTGCATWVVNAPKNAPLMFDSPPGMASTVDVNRENVIALSFSGGGLRAAAFAHGALRALEELRTPDGDLIDDVGYIGSVSGGSLAAAYYGLHGRAGLARFRDEVLVRDYEQFMRLSVFLPENLSRLLGGGLNGRENFVDRLDRDVFRGATFDDLYRRSHADIRIHATDLYHRIPFPFTPRVFSILCSEIRSYSVADAVAASMAVPLVFAPVVLRTYPEHCNEPLPQTFAAFRADPDAPRLLKAIEQAMRAYRDPDRTRYVKLVDGGVTDHLGLSTLITSRAILGTPYAPLTERDAARIRRMLFIVVDASRTPNGDWGLREEGPGGVDVALYATDAAVDSSARLIAVAFENMLREWQDAIATWRCALSEEDAARLDAYRGAACDDVRFSVAFLSLDNVEPPLRDRINAVPTRLTLDAAQIDDTIEGARRATLALPRLQQYLRSRGGTLQPTDRWALAQ